MGQDSVTGAGLGSEPNNQGTKWYARSVVSGGGMSSVGIARVAGCSLRRGSSGDAPPPKGHSEGHRGQPSGMQPPYSSWRVDANGALSS